MAAANQGGGIAEPGLRHWRGQARNSMVWPHVCRFYSLLSLYTAFVLLNMPSGGFELWYVLQPIREPAWPGPPTLRLENNRYRASRCYATIAWCCPFLQ